MSLPNFSIIIPTYNRPHELARCLAALLNLDYPRACFELIVVDDGGSADLQSIIDPQHVMLIRQPNTGPAAARNMGAENASSEFLAFTDDDCIPDAGWLLGFVNVLQSVPDCLAGGCTVNHLTRSLAPSASQYLQDYVYRYYNHDPLNAFFFASNNMAVSRAGFQQMGGFDSSFGRSASEDRDLCDRWRLAGRRMCYAPHALISHAHHMSLADFWQQHFGYGKGAFQFHRRRAARHQAPIRVEPATFYLNMLHYPFRIEPAPRAALISLLMGLSQVASAAGFFLARGASGSESSQ